MCMCVCVCVCMCVCETRHAPVKQNLPPKFLHPITDYIHLILC